MSTPVPPEPALPDAALLDAVRSAGLDAAATPGSLATDLEYRTEAVRVVTEFGRLLSRLHAIEVPPGTDVLDAASIVRRANEALADGRLDALELGAAYRHMTVERLVDVLADGAVAAGERANRPVPTHGRPTLSRFRWSGHEPVGLLDWSALQVADRNRDLAAAARSVATELDPSLLPAFFDAYGHDHLELLQLDWYSLALELEPDPA